MLNITIDGNYYLHSVDLVLDLAVLLGNLRHLVLQAHQLLALVS